MQKSLPAGIRLMQHANPHPTPLAGHATDGRCSYYNQQLRRSLLDYAASNRFQPKVTLPTADLAALWPGSSSAPAAGPRALDPDLDDGSGRAAQKKG